MAGEQVPRVEVGVSEDATPREQAMAAAVVAAATELNIPVVEVAAAPEEGDNGQPTTD